MSSSSIAVPKDSRVATAREFELVLPAAPRPSVLDPSALGEPLDPAGSALRDELMDEGIVVERKLGAGGQGALYLARHPRFFPDTETGPRPELFALKVLRPEKMGDQRASALFREEIRTAVFSDHPHVLVPTWLGELKDGRLFYMTRFIAGGTLEERLSECRTDAAVRQQCLTAMVPVLDALHWLHRRRGIIHRDVKPANILFDITGKPFLTDFGVARPLAAPGDTQSRLARKLPLPRLEAAITSADRVVGTVHYISPEAVRSESLTPKSDQYAVGVILHQVLLGVYPHGSGTSDEVLRRTRDYSVPDMRSIDSRIDRGLAEVVHKLLEGRPEGGRYPSARKAARALQAALEAGPEGGLHDRPQLSPTTQRAAELARLLEAHCSEPDGYTVGARLPERPRFVLEVPPPEQEPPQQPAPQKAGLLERLRDMARRIF